jgi:hypothetical protein
MTQAVTLCACALSNGYLVTLTPAHYFYHLFLDLSIVNPLSNGPIIGVEEYIEEYVKTKPHWNVYHIARMLRCLHVQKKLLKLNEIDPHKKIIPILKEAFMRCSHTHGDDELKTLQHAISVMFKDSIFES